MRNRFIRSIFALGAVLVFSPVILAQTAKPSGAAKAQAAAPTPDLSGVWLGQSVHRFFKPNDVLPMQPWAEEKFKTVREGQDPTDKGRNDIDPALTRCAPPGFPRILAQPYPMEIVQLPGRVLMLFELDHWVRHIYTDGREHPKDPDPTWMGHSIGRWDGDTFVVDTIGLTDKTWLDIFGYPHSDALHVVERYRRVNHGSLQVGLTFEDPKAYTKPWKGQFSFTLRPGWEIEEQVLCEDRSPNEAR
ncbi:MAG: hypothetical protein A3J28_09640 [Acidobacteria bacterium RIFCSPLOWO2_12_FULL_60_22]|nr:MAG: hypothetical protein A3J28_09640 [Acidobacteria bacterium RIFCSPLOWO2_12_FULL_60_22]